MEARAGTEGRGAEGSKASILAATLAVLLGFKKATRSANEGSEGRTLGAADGDVTVAGARRAAWCAWTWSACHKANLFKTLPQAAQRRLPHLGVAHAHMKHACAR